jgi:23S rRNA (pseudouridine1915-N3)-methyltransferase
MKIRLLVLGKTNETFLRLAEEKYMSRLAHYVNFERQDLPDVKQGGQLGLEQLKRKEGQSILALIKEDDVLVLLDERGEELNSVQFSKWLEKKFQASSRRITFCVGGAFGFSEEVYQRSNSKISLSKMTFSHQMVRMIFLEQLYRACTITKGEKYHHE